MAIIPFGFWSKKQEIITSNLIFYYDPGKTTSYPGSGTTVTDLSTNGWNSTLQNGVGFSSTDGGGSFTFDGNNDRIFPGYPNTGFIGDKFKDQSFTLEAWLKPSSTEPPSAQVYFSILQDGTTGRRFHCRFYSNGIIRMAFFADDIDTTSGQVSFGSWQHITMRYRSSDDTSTIFKNGTQIRQGNVGPLITSTGSDVWIGAFGNTEYWKGSIGAIYAYQSALTDSEITSNYNALKSRYGL
jgi:hypothetical protein